MSYSYPVSGAFAGVRRAMVWLAVIAAAGCARSSTGGARVQSGVHQGAFERRLDLTGDVRAERGDSLAVPQTPAWQIAIRWLVEDGATVAAGDRVVEFDNGQLAGDLDQKRAAADEAQATLRQARAESAGRLEQSGFDLAKARDELAKARVLADVPADILAAREHDDRELAVEHAQADVGKAEAALRRAQAEARESVGAAELALRDKSRALEVTEATLTALVLRAPRAGLALVQDQPWEGRRIQNGDSLYPGLPVIVIPDLDSLYLVATLYDVDDGAIHAGDSARCFADAHPAEPFPCRVREVAAVARELSSQTTRRAFRVELDFADRAAARERLRPGMSMRAEIVAERRASARLAPRARLVVAPDAVRLRLPSGALEAIRLGPCNATDCVVEDGAPVVPGAPQSSAGGRR